MNNSNKTNYNSGKEFNLIGRRFSKVFDVLLDTGYYEGTKFANFFDEINSDGTSKIYVKDDTESAIDHFVASNINQIKYLVGLTGMGKTTLIRNYFKITDRDVKIENEKIIIYISFFNSDLLFDNPELSVKNEIIKYLSRAVGKLLETNQKILLDEKCFWENFYLFIEKNKPALLMNEDILPGVSLFDNLLLSPSSEYDKKIKKIKKICETNPLEYYTCLIKYIIRETKINYKIFIIYDDIESKSEKFHSPVVEAARHIHACFCANEGKNILIKSLIVLRAYTFRSNIGRQSEARRESVKNDLILKKSSADLLEIFSKRFEFISEKKSVDKTSNYPTAKEVLEYVAGYINKIGNSFIYCISNYNICDSMIIYSHIITNLNWIACNEEEYKGAFQLDKKYYRVTTDNIIRAISEISNDQIIDNYSFIPNILYNEKDGTELIGLYIIKLFIQKGANKVYGEKYIQGDEVISDIVSIFTQNTDMNYRNEYWEYRVRAVLTYLFNSGILLRSVYDIEIPNDSQIKRQFRDDYKLYLSPRGMALYNTLSKNASLLKLYINDMSLDTSNLSNTYIENTTQTFIKILEYIDYSFSMERRYIAESMPSLDSYQEKFGKEFIASTLLDGVVDNMYVYYKEENRGDDYNSLMQTASNIFISMLDYSNTIKDKYNVEFKISTDLTKHINHFTASLDY